ncbi:MAG: phospho-sugar mutase, partial [Oscillospiraceae bacterium]|nr:phospho-sugar mutase [Oscillospiraceae bacterium]
MNTQETLAYWLENYPDYKDEIEAITDDKEREDRFYRSLEFGTAGMRGVLGAGENRMNAAIIRRVSIALADVIKTDAIYSEDRHVVIGFDSRRMSAEFAMETARTLATFGIKCRLFDSLRPVPALSFAIRHTKAIAGVEITASHNPPQYNGYKVYWSDGAQMPPAQADAIVLRLKDDPAFVPISEAEARSRGLILPVPEEADDAYVAYVSDLAIQKDMLRRHGGELEIAYTPLHGAGLIPVKRVLANVGITNLSVVKEQEKPDGEFPTVRVPNPEIAETMSMVVELANKIGAD